MIWKFVRPVLNELFLRTIENKNSVILNKSKDQWTENESKKDKYMKVWKVLIVFLRIDEYYNASHCDIAKVIRDTLQVTHKGTNEVKQLKTNTLTQEYEFFHTKHGDQTCKRVV